MIQCIFLVRLCLFNTPLMINIDQDAQMLKLNIQSEKESYAIGESVWLKISLQNTGKKTVKICYKMINGWNLSQECTSYLLDRKVEAEIVLKT